MVCICESMPWPVNCINAEVLKKNGRFRGLGSLNN
jgi:hypothetical protein